MSRNMSIRDRKVRIFASAALTIVALLGSYSITFVLILYGTAAILLLTAATGHCPMYRAGSAIRRRRALQDQPHPK